MNLKLIIIAIAIVIVLVIVFAVWYFYSLFLPEQPQSVTNVSNQDQQGINVSQPEVTIDQIRLDTKDKTTDIAKDLENIPDDSSGNKELDSLNKELQNF